MNTAKKSTPFKTQFSKKDIPTDYNRQYTLLFIKKELLWKDRKESFEQDLADLLGKSERLTQKYIYKEKKSAEGHDLKGYEIRIIADWLGIAISDVFTEV